MIAISTSNYGATNLPMAYADQLLIRYNSSKIIYMSVYGYNSTLNYLKASASANVRGGKDAELYRDLYANLRTDELNLDLHFLNDGIHLSNEYNAVKSKITRIPDTDYVQMVNYLDVEQYNIKMNLGNTDRYNPMCKKACYIRLKKIVDFTRQERPDITDRDIAIMLKDRTALLHHMVTSCPEVQHKIFNIIKTTNVPFLEEWTYYFIHTPNTGINIDYPIALYSDLNAEDNMYVIFVDISENCLKYSITRALERKTISINGCTSISESNSHVNTLTDYLTAYSDQLIDKATTKFRASFDPATDSFTQRELDFFEYAEYAGKLKFFNAQKNVIGALNRSLKTKRSAFVVGECGSGKTALATAAIYCNESRKNITTVVMAPGHLVYKWQREILRLYPDARAEIIDDFSDLQMLEPVIKNKLRNQPLFLILSKDIAKVTYVERPAAIWNSRKNIFTCPTCGASLSFRRSPKKAHLEDGEKSANSSRLGQFATVYPIYKAVRQFATKGDWNSICDTEHPKRSTKNGKNEAVKGRKRTPDDHSCGQSLWTSTYTREETKWIRHPSFGWIHEDMMTPFKSYYERSIDDSFTNDEFNKKLYRAIIDIEENGKPTAPSPRRYSIARYIRKHLKGYIDYFVADEVHLYSSSDSSQACAFGDINRAAKKTIALTGTCLNGYATSIASLLLRLFPYKFVNKGFTFGGDRKFIEKYGVSQETTTVLGRNQVKRNYKPLPGISCELFSDFLLDQAVFISIKDMSDSLPAYSEIPVGVEMDPQTKSVYDSVVKDFASWLSFTQDNKREVAFQMAQKLSIFPDMPYSIAPVMNKDGNIIVNIPDAVENIDTFISNKDLKCLEMVQEKIERGANVLIYVNYVNKTNCSERLVKMFETAGIKVANLTAKVKSQDREQWIADRVAEGCRVLICNPALVETGLDLLDFTEIIFYSMGYNLFTMRQAARRSYRLNQIHDVTVSFLYFENTTQESILSLMASKLQAAKAIEGDFSEEGLNALSNNDDLLTQLAEGLVRNINYKINAGDFTVGVGTPEREDGSRFRLAEEFNEEVSNTVINLFETTKKKTSFSLQNIYEQLELMTQSA